ncbi:MAG: hypothetical protein AB7E30_04815 [Lawsonibacter sp.]
MEHPNSNQHVVEFPDKKDLCFDESAGAQHGKQREPAVKQGVLRRAFLMHGQ